MSCLLNILKNVLKNWHYRSMQREQFVFYYIHQFIVENNKILTVLKTEITTVIMHICIYVNTEVYSHYVVYLPKHQACFITTTL